ncbi:Alkylated DNA repair dioxygenase AlkB [Onishia taeanensis]|uniref:Alkylated DNA repair dioxygenase AlkB n=1 Tax=Onishia taeanensis TaxID=284577 RepID=A0A1G7QHQ8_9GAMM|nr:alpha-ketoglutarate-dependent dioxygenase AlkB [Halomonas taeanensis]SDF98042.1 Alkylated DNA repair dioxygenase AlkB [Halomonas taeanensis]
MNDERIGPPCWQTLLDSPPMWLGLGLFGLERANELQRQLDQQLHWQRPTLTLYGRQHLIPRRQIWMGDPDAAYRYSGESFTPAPWHPAVEEIKVAVERSLEASGQRVSFNSVLLNRYADGEDRMGWHSDDEAELGEDPLIAAVSLGAERPLRFRWQDRRGAAFNVWLPHDSLLVMGPGTQRQLQHALLPRKLPGMRISLTFRRVYPR